ncbi:hypothetical protein ABT095_13215 [Kitasatospora sp. NPDC002227]|uniref:hypothetical protein n=1 Tax=Kitasatospora sp. NPDC002227 TaxID=3154773 RepID=UPI00331B59FC
MPSHARTALRVAALALAVGAAVSCAVGAPTAQGRSSALPNGTITTVQGAAAPHGLPCPACWD